MGLEGKGPNMQRDGYVKVRKVRQSIHFNDNEVDLVEIVITPTRYVYIAPEQIMGNRILRKYYGTQTEILRITFRFDRKGGAVN